jgi:hypothetical protein
VDGLTLIEPIGLKSQMAGETTRSINLTSSLLI